VQGQRVPGQRPTPGALHMRARAPITSGGRRPPLRHEPAASLMPEAIVLTKNWTLSYRRSYAGENDTFRRSEHGN
jgi:hypothetical protein